MDTVVAVWFGIGALVWLGMLFSGESDGILVMFIVILFGPLIIIWLGFQFLIETGEKTTPSTKNKQTRSSSRPPEQEIEDLIKELSPQFLGALHPHKSHYVRLQRLCVLLCQSNNDVNMKKEPLDLLMSGLRFLDDVYNEGQSIKRTRKKFILSAISVLDPNNAALIENELMDVESQSSNKGRFGLTIDVDALKEFFQGWTVNDDFPGDDSVLLVSPDGCDLRISEHKVDNWNSFEDQVELYRKATSTPQSFLMEFPDAKLERPFEEGKTSNGLRYSIFEISEDARYRSVVNVEGSGFRRAYITTEALMPTSDMLLKALVDFVWIPNTEIAVKTFKNSRQLRQEVKRFCGRDGGELSEVMDSIQNDYIYLSYFDLTDAAIEAPETQSLIRAIIRFALDNTDISEHDWHDLVSLVKPGGLNYLEAYNEILSLIQKNDPSCDALLVLAKEGKDAGQQQKWLLKAIASATDFYDLQKIVKNPLFKSNFWLDVEVKIEENLTNEDFYIGNVIDVLGEAVSKDLVSTEKTINFARRWLDKPLNPETAFSVTQSIYEFYENDKFKGESETLVRLVDIGISYLEKNVSDADMALEVIGFIKDELKDEPRAKSFKAQHEKTIAAYNEESEKSEAWDEAINNICKCAVIVAAGDGKVTELETNEVSQVKPWIVAFLENREAVRILEKTGNQELALEKSGELILKHEMMIFGAPTFVREAFSDIEAADSHEDIFSLTKAYASKISDPYHKRLALWSAEETAAADGLADGEIALLDILASEFGLDRTQNKRFFKGVAFPAIDATFTYSNPDEVTSNIFEEIDNHIEDNGESAEDLSTLMETLGVSSFSEIASILLDDDDSGKIQDSVAPEIFTFFESGEWTDVSKAIENGADVNQTMNYSGLQDFHILTLCAQQGPSEVLSELIEAGADVNARQGNLDLQSGYETPLIAALKGDRVDNFELLLDAGAQVDPFHDGEAGWTPLTMAASHENIDAIKLLLKAGADANVSTADGRNAIKTLAMSEGPRALKCLRILAKAGCEANKRDKEGYHPIHNAVTTGDKPLVKFFVEEAKVPVDTILRGLSSSMDFSSPIDRALAEGYSDIAEYLYSKGASLFAGFDLKKAEALSSHNAFSAIFYGAMESQLDMPLVWLDRAMGHGLKPNLPTLLLMIQRINNYGSDETMRGWSTDMFEKLLESIESTTDDLQELLDDDWEDSIEGALYEAPVAVGAIIKAFEKQGMDIGVDLLD